MTALPSVRRRSLRRFLPLLPALSLALLGPSTAEAKRAPKSKGPLPTIVVAPFVTSTDAAEYQWIGSAFSESLTDRLLTSDEASVVSQKQWAAVLRERDIAARTIVGEQDAEAIARQLGASEYVFGRYQARWPDVVIKVARYQVGQEKPLVEATVVGALEDLVDVEKKVAKAMFDKTFKKAAKGPSPAKNVKAWHALTLCRDELSHQSLGPRAAVWLPTPLAQQALEHCQAAKKADKKNAQAEAFEALGLYLVGQKKKAEKQIKKVAKNKKRPAGWADQIAYFIAKNEGDDKGAVKALEAALAKHPGLLHARTTLGEHHLVAGDDDAAKAAFEETLAAAPSQPWALIQLGKLKAKGGDIDGALADTDAALKLVPGDAVLLMERASRLIDGKRWTEAETTLREAMAQDPRLAAAYLRLGYVYLETNQLDLAAPILQKALYEADRESERRIRGYAHYDLAKLYGRLRDDDRALTELGRAVKAGFGEKDRFASDPDLQTVAKSEAFAKLFANGAVAAPATPAPATAAPATPAAPAPQPTEKTDKSAPAPAASPEPVPAPSEPAAAPAPAAPAPG